VDLYLLKDKYQQMAEPPGLVVWAGKLVLLAPAVKVAKPVQPEPEAQPVLVAQVAKAVRGELAAGVFTFSYPMRATTVQSYFWAKMEPTEQMAAKAYRELPGWLVCWVLAVPRESLAPEEAMESQEKPGQILSSAVAAEASRSKRANLLRHKAFLLAAMELDSGLVTPVPSA
jgi:hypothetical protein